MVCILPASRKYHWHEQFDFAILLKLCYEHFYHAHYHTVQFCRDAFIHRCLETSSKRKHAYRLPKRNFGVDCDRHKPYRRKSRDFYIRGAQSSNLKITLWNGGTNVATTGGGVQGFRNFVNKKAAFSHVRPGR